MKKILIFLSLFLFASVFAQDMQLTGNSSAGLDGIYVNMGPDGLTNGHDYYQKGSIYLYNLFSYYWVVGINLSSQDTEEMYYYGEPGNTTPDGNTPNIMGGLATDNDFPTISAITALPVELTSFTAVLFNEAVILNWQTETETNNIGFEIERKYQESSLEYQDEKQSWETIGFVKGYGHSSSPRYYSFVDENIKSNSNHSYRLKQIDNDGSYEYSQIVKLVQSVPSNFNLSQNYPNPFNPTTNINFSIPVVDAKFASTTNVTLKVYDILGKEVSEIVNDKLEVGNYSYEFNASKLSSGLYFYTIKADNFVATKKMLLVK